MGDFVSWVLIIALAVAWLRSRRDRDRDRQLWGELANRVNELEANLADLRRRLADRAAVSAPAVESPKPQPVARPLPPPVLAPQPEPAVPLVIKFPPPPTPVEQHAATGQEAPFQPAELPPQQYTPPQAEPPAFTTAPPSITVSALSRDTCTFEGFCLFLLREFLY